jgi:hypothetical protein
MPPTKEPRTFKEWYIIAIPVKHKNRQDRATHQCTTLSKGPVALINPFLMIVSLLHR